MSVIKNLIPLNNITSFRDYYELFLKVNTLLDTVNQLTNQEVDEFGWYLNSTFFDQNHNENEDEQENYSKIDIRKMLVAVLSECTTLEEAENIIDNLIDDLSYPVEDISESVSRRMLPSHLNHKRRKFMKKSRAVLRREKTKRKRLNRLTRMKRKRYYKANKLKIKAYQKSRRSMIKRGRHIVKLRRRA